MDNADRSEASGQLFGDLLRTLRRASGFTQAELAERANLSARGLSDLERGINHSPRRETLLALADAFGLTDEERHRFFAAGRRQSALATPSASLPSSSSAGSQPELVPLHKGLEGAGPMKPTDDIQVFLIADVRGYSTYTDAHRDEDAAQLALRFAALADAAVAAHGGQVLEVRGDEVLAVFSSARSALRAAIRLQEQVRQASETAPEQPIRCGIGVEAGEAVPVPGGYRGQAINLAARLCARAGPGEVLAGEAVIGLARKVEGLVFLDRGLSPLKGVAVPVRITQVVAAPMEAPSEPLGERAIPLEPGEPAEGPRRGAAVGNFLSAEPRHRLVAREAEMTRLLAILDTVQAGTGQLVLVVGEPGVGKTRLAQEVLHAARAQGFGGITGRCYAPQATVPYYPFLEALSRAAAAAPQALRSELPLHWPEVARLIPDQRLGTRATSPIPPLEGGGGTGDQQQRLFWQVTGFLQALADEQPLALLLDDLHWADGASLELLLHLARQTHDCPLLLLGTYRESEVPSDHPLAVGVRDLIRAHLVERNELQQLSREGTAALLSATLEGGDVSEAVTSLIYGPTEGNAFFVQELLRTLLERGEIFQGSDGRWESREGAAAAVPATVQAAVLERISHLSAPAQETLGLASVLGQRFRFDDLLATASRILQTPEDPAAAAAPSEVEAESRLEAVLEEAVHARVLREVGGSEYAFSHALAQQALYEPLSVRRRRRIHRAVAESLERLGGTERSQRAADLAYHFLQAAELARALPHVLQAGEQALLVYAYPEAERQFRLALELAQQLGDGDAPSTAAERLGAALVYQARDDEALVVLEPAITEAERRGDLARLARLSWLLKNVGIKTRADAETITYLRRVIELAEARGPSPDLAQLYLSLAQEYMRRMEDAENLWALERALQVAQAAHDLLLVARARPWYGMALRAAGRLEEALVELEAAVPVLEQQGAPDDREELRVTLIELGLVLTHLGRVSEAHAHFERALALGEQLRWLPGVAAVSACCCETAFVRGDWTAAERYIERAEALRPHFETNPYMRGILYSADGPLQMALGQWDAAAYSGESVLALAKDSGDLESLRDVQRVLAELDLHQGDPTSARDRLLPLLDREGLVEMQVNPLLPLLVWAHLDLGEIEAAEALAMQTVTRLRTQNDHLTLVDTLRMEAAVRMRQDRWDEAETALDEALQLSRPMPYPYAEAKALATYGDLMVATGQPERARDQYTAALAILCPLREVPYAERIERALAERARH